MGSIICRQEIREIDYLKHVLLTAGYHTSSDSKRDVRTTALKPAHITHVEFILQFAGVIK